ncbi:MAG: hypothetical protein Q8P67_10205, partial [archaeon]|nr:hypothetical protein [archaeon]
RIPRTPTTVALPPTAIPSSAGSLSEHDPPAIKRRRTIHTDPGYIRKFEHSRAPPSLDIQDQLFDTMTKPMSLSRQLAQLEAQARLQRAARQLSSVQHSSLKSDSQPLSASSSSSSTMVSLPEEYDLLNGDDESASGLLLTPTRDQITLSHLDNRFDSSGARTFPRSSPSRVLSYQLPHLKSEALPSSGLSSPQPVIDLSTPVRPPIRSPLSQALSLSFQPSSSLPVANDDDSLQFEDAESLVLPDSQSWITEDVGSISASTSRPEEMDEPVDIDGPEEGEEEASSEEKEASSEETESFPLPPLPRLLAIPVVEPRSRPSRAPPAAVSSDRRMSLSRALRLIEEAQKQWVASSFEPPR